MTDLTTTDSTTQSNMPLFYNDPRPLDAKIHVGLKLNRNFGFGFTAQANAVPVNMIEMPQVCHYYPIAFSPDGNATPVAILGVRDNENLFLTPQQNWKRDIYIPAYIRRYPFIFSEMHDGETLTLCADFVPGVLDEYGQQPIFTPDGSPSELASNALEFCKSYHAAANQTQEFSQFLLELDLLVEREAQINMNDSKRINFSGFQIIDEKRLADLGDTDYLKLRSSGMMPFVYAHLFSGSQWQRLTSYLNAQVWRDDGEDNPLSKSVREVGNLLARSRAGGG